MTGVVPLIKPRIVEVFDRPNSADAALICRADDNMIYCVKQATPDRPELPANEWFCSNLAHLIGIPVPGFLALLDLDRKPVFGSRWESGTPIIDPTRYIAAIPSHEIFWRIFAFDLFIHNEDRHIGNYLFRDRNSQKTVMAMDFSRAWTYRGWPVNSILPDSCNTMTTFINLINKGIIRYSPDLIAAAQDLLNRLGGVATEKISSIIGSMPPEWNLGVSSDELLLWWMSSARSRADIMANRIREVTWKGSNIQSSG